MATPNEISTSAFNIPKCQEDVQSALASLRSLGSASELQSWSSEQSHAYKMALESIGALSLRFQVYSASCQKVDSRAPVPVFDSSPQGGCSICRAPMPVVPPDQIREMHQYCSDHCREQGYRGRQKSRRYKAFEKARRELRGSPVRVG